MLLTSIVVPFIAVTTSPGFIERPLGMFSVAPTMRDDVDGQLERGDRAHRLEHGGAARHVELHLVHLRRRA